VGAFVFLWNEESKESFNKFMKFLTVYWIAAFGVWTLLNYTIYIQAPKECFLLGITLTDSTYNIAVTIGTFPAIIVVVTLIVSFIYAPFKLCKAY
jgi:hypothetical protein